MSEEKRPQAEVTRLALEEFLDRLAKAVLDELVRPEQAGVRRVIRPQPPSGSQKGSSE